ncbi:phosphomethylpyrimidine synthase ThiC [Massilibacteroides sp.]|uniref:phosphomethylpyrimidine synthase ThiC n=1 Tax=Massilibacteroides sp. TaxID=2034766 RepID=UPI002607D8C0|nr:phosphomethylpyrimidine synthase ThiC [Massilibacteroides sp.]MDD4514118.1 phosphomethylpyrimidine synthase ThiC [Massilibacteroides sp.]
MATKKNIRINFPASEKVYIRGEMNRIQVGVRRVTLSDTVFIDKNGKKSVKKNNPVILYDTTGPYSDSKIELTTSTGIPRIKEEWNIRRKDQIRINNKLIAKQGKNITQMFYAKRRIITPEMEYVAIRENQQVEELGLKSHITPDFVRKEIAAGRAVIPSNINHPEAEPMIIGKNFLVKVATRICYEQAALVPEKEMEKIAWFCKWGNDLFLENEEDAQHTDTREFILRHSPIPYASTPIFDALKQVGTIDNLTWKVFREVIVNQAEQGVDCFCIHAGLLKKHSKHTDVRLTGITDPAGLLLKEWMKITNKENFLYTHFTDICEILKQYDITLVLSSALRSASIYDSNDAAQFAELRVLGEVAKRAKEHFIQTIVEGPGHTPLNKIQEGIKEQQYICQQIPFFSSTPVSTDIAPGQEYISSAIGAAQIAWQGVSLIADQTSYSDKERIKDKLIAHKIAAHSADIAKGHPGSQVRDNALSKARFDGRKKDVCNLSVDPAKTAKFI